MSDVYFYCANPSTSSIKTSQINIIGICDAIDRENLILNAIAEDLIEGAVEGLLCIDAYGVSRRVYIDIVGVISGKPSINASFNMKVQLALVLSHMLLTQTTLSNIK